MQLPIHSRAEAWLLYDLLAAAVQNIEAGEYQAATGLGSDKPRALRDRLRPLLEKPS